MAFTFIDSHSSLADLLDSLTDLATSPPSLYLDLEGNNLSRYGSVSILQLFVQPRQRVYLIDTCTLGSHAFTTAGSSGRTLKSVLESTAIPKVFFDVRNDSDALFSHFGIRLSNIEDLQLMEFATRTSAGKYLSGLAKCIERDATMSHALKQQWKTTKEQGHNLFDPAHGGSYAVFDIRPLTKEIQLYCVQDVINLPDLRKVYATKISGQLWEAIHDATHSRIRESQGSHFNGKGKHMTLPPWPKWPKGKPHSVTTKPSTPNGTAREKFPSSFSALQALEALALDATAVTSGETNETRLIQSKVSQKQDLQEEGSGIPSKFVTAAPEAEKGEAGNAKHGDVDMSPNETKHRASYRDIKGADSYSNGDVKEISSVRAYFDGLRDFGSSKGGMRPSYDLDDDYDGNNLNDEDWDSPGDYTACSLDDCGYCGHCKY